MDRYRSRPTWLYGYSTDAHSVHPGRTDMAQANLATLQLHTVSVQDGQIWLKANMAVWPQHRCTQCPSRTDRYRSNQPGHTTDAHSVHTGWTDIAQGQHGCMATAQMHTVSVQDGQIWLKPTWLHHSCTQCPSRMDRYRSRPTWLYGHSTDAHSVRPGRTDIAQGQHGCMTTAQKIRVAGKDGQKWQNGNMATAQQKRRSAR